MLRDSILRDFDSLPMDINFLLVEGIPVTLDMDSDDPNTACLAWDTVPPRKFPWGSAAHNGKIVSRSDFEKFIEVSY